MSEHVGLHTRAYNVTTNTYHWLMAAVTRSIQVTFLCGLRGYHEYRFTWSPSVNEVLRARHERNNRYAIAVTKQLPGFLTESVVGHLPREISRLTYFIILHGARVLVKVLDAHHRKSPLIQGGIEIPVEVTVEMAATEENRLALAKYEAMTAERYKEPVDGKYQDATAAILAGLGSELEADVELSGCSSESELGEENAQPTTEESGTKSGSDEEGIDASDEVRIDVSDGEGTDSLDEEGTFALVGEGTDASVGEVTDSSDGEDLLKIDVSRGVSGTQYYVLLY